MRTRDPAAIARHSYLRWAIALVGGLILIAISSITISERVYPASTSSDSAEMTIGGVSTFEQTFSTTQANLTGLTIRVRTNEPGDANLEIPIHLRYEGGPPIDLVSMSLPLDAAHDEELTFSFPSLISARDSHAITETLRLIIDVPPLPPSSGPRIVVASNPQEQGMLLIDGAPALSYDLIVIPHYQRRWIDSLWPISQMAAGKPGLLGWPPLYTLLPYLYTILLIQVAIVLRGEIHPAVDA